MILVVALAALTAAITGYGCGPAGKGPPPSGGSLGADLAARVRLALDRGVPALIGEPGHDIGTLNAVRRIGEVLGRVDARAFVARERSRFEMDLYRGLLFRDLPPAPLLPQPGRGYQRLQWYLTHAASGADPARSQAVVEEFLGLDLHGFGLTHQILAVVWMRDVGVAETPAIAERLAERRRRLRQEIEALPSFSDLFAEQVAVLLWSDPEARCPEAWIAKIVDAQKPDGLFEDPTNYRITFDGESWDVRASRAHTSAQALAALAQALGR